ncbi:uncharacterized protein LOC126721809 [Quercus robur]|uniref:uncharacterized protein LOC126721809 n=1 Tax=Quercus robur TaxID=38942 RepID=UPI002162BB65|nr:uncharacterized protein LOC126721809 [Quercus robur]
MCQPTQLTRDRTQQRPTATHAAANLQNPYEFCRKFGETLIKQAQLLKRDGNSYFKKDRIGVAIDTYTEAITLCPNVPMYLMNRALCHRKRNCCSQAPFFYFLARFEGSYAKSW